MSGFGIISTPNEEEVLIVHSVGRINREIYKCITKDIVTEEVIITENQIKHIQDRHPDSFEKAAGHAQIVLRVCTSEDEYGYKNSIISCWEISEKRLQNYLRNKRILYKRV